MGTSHLVQVRPRWDHTHQVQVTPRYIESIQVPMMARKRPESTGPGEAQIWNRVIVFQVRPDGDHRNQVLESQYGNQSQQIQVRSRWDHSHKVQVRRRWQQDSPSPVEAQVATSHQILVRTS